MLPNGSPLSSPHTNPSQLEEVVVATAKMTQNGNVFGRAKSAQDDTELCGWRREEMRTTVRFNISSSHRQAPVV